MAVDHERNTQREYEDYIDRAQPAYDVSKWGVVLGIAALLAILGLLFVGIGSSPNTTPTEPVIERTAPTPSPATPTTEPAPTPAPNPAPAPN